MGARPYTRRGRRHLPKSKRLQLVDLREHVTDAEVLEAIARLDRSAVVAPIEARLKRRADAERRASVEGLLFAVLVNTSRPNHKACELSLTKILNGLSPAMRARLGMPDWRVVGSYDRVHRLYKAICKNLDEGWVHRHDDSGEELVCDWAWFTHQLLLASIPEGMLRALKNNVALAVDGTDMQTCAQIHADLSSVDLDGEAVIPDDGATARRTARGKIPRATRKGTKAKVLGVGPDGRNIYTKDPDARAGWRGGNSNHNEGKYLGREAHLGVAVPRLVNSDGVTWTKFGPEVPPFVLTAQLVAAGSHRGKSVVDSLCRAHEERLCADVVVDAGYSLSAAEYFHIPLKQAGIELTMQPVTHQRGASPASVLLGRSTAISSPSRSPRNWSTLMRTTPRLSSVEPHTAIAGSRHRAPTGPRDGSTLCTPGRCEAARCHARCAGLCACRSSRWRTGPICRRSPLGPVPFTCGNGACLGHRRGPRPWDEGSWSNRSTPCSTAHPGRSPTSAGATPSSATVAGSSCSFAPH
jgi:hypothetical protein